MSKHTVISLFSGCGGMDLGFLGGFDFLGKRYKNLPFKIIWANELNKAACATYSANINPHIINSDIWSVIDDLPKQADIIIGGFPCQDISINGKKAGVDGNRSGLYKAMVEAVKRVKPKVFVAENVKGLLMEYNKTSLERVITDFSELGYDVSYELYNSADYNVPQTRERVLIIGLLKGMANFTHPVKSVPQEKRVSAESAIKDLEDVPEDKTFNHTWSRAKRSAGQGGRELKHDRPATTIRAECHGNIQFHYKLERRISMREAARFQSFPDNFIFKSNLRETERQVGNAVPPVLAWHFANHLASYLEEATALVKESAVAL